MSIHLFGIRHHGPGSSRHLLQALSNIKPDILLVEGPPEGEKMLSWMADQAMQPPVALLAYVPDEPKRAAFYPFTSFSPEWNAIRYALQHNIPVRFMDMPLCHQLVEEETVNLSPTTDTTSEQTEGKNANEQGVINDQADDPDNVQLNATEVALQQGYSNHPISQLAAIDGFEDDEQWWEQRFELTNQPETAFEAVAMAMTALRADEDQQVEDIKERAETSDRHQKDLLREAFMRKAIREALKEMYTEIVVVCGAWHVPALKEIQDKVRIKQDEVLIKKLPRTKVETTWIPWSNDRLSYQSGYGAGILSPGWYQHIWDHPNDEGAIWLTHTAVVFREHKIDISSAHIIEAVKMSRSLAVLRGLHRPGLSEFNDAVLATMCIGDEVLLQLIWDHLIVGKGMGQIPQDAPQSPLQADFSKQAKSLRLKITNEFKVIQLDLREEKDLQKSILLHQLLILGIHWGEAQLNTGKGTFKEEWQLKWYPELSIELLEKAPWGNTVASAANKYLEHRAANSQSLEEMTLLIKDALPAALDAGIQAALKRLDSLAVNTTDVGSLMQAFIPLVQVSRYGNVRKADAAIVKAILTSLFYRIEAGLPIGSSSLSSEEAAKRSDTITQLTNALLLIEDKEMLEIWEVTLDKTMHIDQTAPIIQGTICKILLEQQYLTQEQTATAFTKALSINYNPAESADWLEGFLKEAATVLILNDAIWNIMHSWIVTLNEEDFLKTLPLLRRTFSLFAHTEKQKIAERAKHGVANITGSTMQMELDLERAGKILPVLKQIMQLT